MTRRTLRKQRAQSMIEFAIFLPAFLLLLFATLDFARLLFSYISLVNGAREMVRGAAITSRSTAGADAVNDFNNLTLIGGPFSGATTVNLTGSAKCTDLTSAGCRFSLTPTGSTMSLTAGTNAAGTGVITLSGSYFGPTALGASANGDYAILTAVDGWYTTGTVQICQLPITSACAASMSNQYANGFVQVDAVYTFNFNPLFQTKLDGIIDVWFMRPTSVLTTTARSYVE